MRITTRYQDGSVEEFNTNTLTSEGALGKPNALTDLRVTLGDGLWVEATWYTATQGDWQGCDMPMARRMPGCRLHVLSESELEQVRSIEIDGQAQWLRIGPDLSDVALLDEVSDLLYEAEEPSRSMVGRAMWLHDHLKDVLAVERNGTDLETRACAALGMTEASYRHLSQLTTEACFSDDW